VQMWAKGGAVEMKALVMLAVSGSLIVALVLLLLVELYTSSLLIVIVYKFVCCFCRIVLICIGIDVLAHCQDDWCGTPSVVLAVIVIVYFTCNNPSCSEVQYCWWSGAGRVA